MRKELLTYKEPKSPISETFRTLRTNIQFMNTDRKLKTLLVTSTFPNEGKSWVTSNLAVTFAQAGKRVIIIDADMRKGRQYSIFDVSPKPGLSNFLSNMGADDMETNDISIVNYIQETDVENLHILTAGNVPPNPSELLVSRKMKDLLKELKEMCDLVIIDGTPCDLVTDSVILSRVVDSTIIVTAQKETKKENLTRTVKTIQNVGGKIAGVVVNKVDMSAKKYNQAYYYSSISGKTLKNENKKSNREMEDFYTTMASKPKKENEYTKKDYFSDKGEIDIYREIAKEEQLMNELANKNNNYDLKKEDTQVVEIPKDHIQDYDNNKTIKEEKHEDNQSSIIEEDIKELIEQEMNSNKKSKKNKRVNYHGHRTEIEAKVAKEGRITEVINNEDFDKKTQEIIRQVNEYIEAEKNRQGE